jgi:hypothetical protein
VFLDPQELEPAHAVDPVEPLASFRAHVDGVRSRQLAKCLKGAWERIGYETGDLLRVARAKDQKKCQRLGPDSDAEESPESKADAGCESNRNRIAQFPGFHGSAKIAVPGENPIEDAHPVCAGLQEKRFRTLDRLLRGSRQPSPFVCGILFGDECRHCGKDPVRRFLVRPRDVAQPLDVHPVAVDLEPVQHLVEETRLGPGGLQRDQQERLGVDDGSALVGHTRAGHAENANRPGAARPDPVGGRGLPSCPP